MMALLHSGDALLPGWRSSGACMCVCFSHDVISMKYMKVILSCFPPLPWPSWCHYWRYVHLELDSFPAWKIYALSLLMNRQAPHPNKSQQKLEPITCAAAQHESWLIFSFSDKTEGTKMCALIFRCARVSNFHQLKQAEDCFVFYCGVFNKCKHNHSFLLCSGQSFCVFGATGRVNLLVAPTE